MRARHRRLHSPLMSLPPMVRYWLWRGIVPVVFIFERIAGRIKRFDWGLFLIQLIGFLTIGSCVVLIILLLISFSYRPVAF